MNHPGMVRQQQQKEIDFWDTLDATLMQLDEMMLDLKTFSNLTNLREFERRN